MLRRVSLIVVLTIAWALSATTSNPCPKGCTCGDSNVAVCNTLNLEPFGVSILSLKIVNPEVPLILKGKPFFVLGLEHLNSISIENATILEIDESAFAGIPLLNSLTIVDCNISDISNSLTFQNVTNLKALRIANSTLKTFSFLKSDSIEELELSGCELTEITEDSFKGLPSLTYISLESNRITKIDPFAFSNLKYLQDVNLARNGITELDQRLFENKTDLDSLDLSDNPLRNFDIKIESELEKLVLRSCELEQFGENLSKSLSMVCYLDLSHNRIKLTKDAFVNMEELEYINLSGNNLTSLDVDIFRANYRLEKIILDDNNFNTIPNLSCDEGRFNTYYFSCKNCGLTSLSVDTFKNFSALIILNLSDNLLTGDDLLATQNLKTLIDLNLSRNNLSFIHPLSFINSSALEKINLSGNPLTVLDSKVFVNNRALKSIDASLCTLKQLWKRPIEIKLKSLEQLNVANGTISSITPMDLGVIPSIKVLDLSGNPIECDPSLKETIIWLNEHEVSPALAFSIWKTRESMNTGDAAKFESTNDDLPDWKELAKQRCPLDYYVEHYEPVNQKIDDTILLDDYDDVYDEYDESDEDGEDDPFKINASVEDDNEKSDQFDDEDSDVDISQLAAESTKFRARHAHYSILWPTLVFIFTALSVLVIAANVMLLIVRAGMLPRHVNLPHIKIPQWGAGSKLKKHSGSVYQPLSEEKSDSYTPIISRKEPATVHNFSLKSPV